MWSCFPLNLWWKEGYTPFVNNMICGKISRDKRYFVNLQSINRWKSAFPLNCKRNIMKLVPIKMPKKGEMHMTWGFVQQTQGWISYQFHTKYLKFSLIFSCIFFLSALTTFYRVIWLKSQITYKTVNLVRFLKAFGCTLEFTSLLALKKLNKNWKKLVIK